jgi:hypothetical protein
MGGRCFHTAAALASKRSPSVCQHLAWTVLLQPSCTVLGGFGLVHYLHVTLGG